MIRLLHGRQKRVLEGHPWIFRSDIDSAGSGCQPGDVVAVVDHRGRWIGKGYYNPVSQIAVRMLTYEDEPVDEAFFQRRIEAAWERRRRLLEDSSSCRVVFGEADSLPALIVDKFSDVLVIQTLALGIDRWKPVIAAILREVLQPRGIYERNDVPVRELEGLEQQTGVLWGEVPGPVAMVENGLRFLVDVREGQKTGHFFDQRDNRRAVRPLAAGVRVLDAFCHTGGFALNAAAGGALQVSAVDSSGVAVQQARDNALANGLADRCLFKEGNAFDELRELVQHRERFGLVVLDPPAFAKNRASLEGALRGYKEINLRALKLLGPGGYLVTCSCSQHLSEDLFTAVLREAAFDAGRRLRLVDRRGQALDHPMLLAAAETSYLKCLVLQVLK